MHGGAGLLGGACRVPVIESDVQGGHGGTLSHVFSLV